MRGLIGLAVFAAMLVIFGWAGESDRRSAMEYEPVRVEIYASAPQWAVRR